MNHGVIFSLLRSVISVNRIEIKASIDGITYFEISKLIKSACVYTKTNAIKETE